MFKNLRFRLNCGLTIGSCLLCGLAQGAVYQPQWEPDPGTMLYSLLFQMDGEIVGTDSLAWPDGRSAMYQYIKTDKGLYRCVDYHDESFVETGNFCWKLKKWPN